MVRGGKHRDESPLRWGYYRAHGASFLKRGRWIGFAYPQRAFSAQAIAKSAETTKIHALQGFHLLDKKQQVIYSKLR